MNVNFILFLEKEKEPTYMADLLVAGGGDAGLGLVRPLRPGLLLMLRPLVLVLVLLGRRRDVLQLHFPEAALPQEALVHLQLLARLLPAAAAFHLQLLDAHLDVLDVVRRDPSPEDEHRSPSLICFQNFSN